MPWIQVIVLGLVQGITELLPVSSSAHLYIVSWLCHWPDQGLTFDVALHIGTLLAIMVYFLPTWIEILTKNLGLLWLLILGSIPGGIVGLLLEHFIEEKLRNPAVAPIVIGINAIVFALLMLWADSASRKTRDMNSLSTPDALGIGIAQALAVIPSVSRSGITMTAALFRDFDRETAARFSFLLATPLIAGAGLKKALELRHTGIPVEMKVPFIAGMTIAGVTTYLVIALFLRYLQTNSLKIFVYYRIAFGIIVLALAILSRPR